MFVPAVLACVGADPGRLAAGRRPGRARVQRRAGRADHRLPVRAGPGHPGRPGGGLRAAAPSWASSSRATRRWSLPARSTPCVLDKTGTVTTGQMTVAGVQAVRGTSRDGPAPLRRLGRAGLRARRWPPPSPRPARAELGELPQADRFAALPGLGARGIVRRPRRHRRPGSLFADRELRSRPGWPAPAGHPEQAGRDRGHGWAGTARPAGPSRWPTRSSRGRRGGHRAADPGLAHRPADRRQPGHRARRSAPAAGPTR